MDITELQEIAEKERANQKEIRVHCCTSTGCRAANSMGVKKNLEAAVKDHGMSDRVQVVGVGCMGFCGNGPLVEIVSQEKLYEQVTPNDSESIINALNGGGIPTAPEGVDRKSVV